MSGPRPALSAALDELFPGARHEPLAGDASTRQFCRLFLRDGGTRVVMDYGAPFQGETDDVRMARIFARAELPVATVFHVLPEAGALVLQDLGDDTLESALGRAGEAGSPTRAGLYGFAVRLAAEIAVRGTDALRHSDRANGPALDAERFLFEMRFFLEHYVGGLLGLPGAVERIRCHVEKLAHTVATHPRVLCHRDYHSRNLMVGGNGRLTMVDIQDARWGPDTYDLASLLHDAYVDMGAQEVETYFDHFAERLPGSQDAVALRERFDLVAAQRMIKALGTFGYQIGVLGRERYRSAIPRTLERLANLLPNRDNLAPLGKVLRDEGLFSMDGRQPLE